MFFHIFSSLNLIILAIHGYLVLEQTSCSAAGLSWGSVWRAGSSDVSAPQSATDSGETLPVGSEPHHGSLLLRAVPPTALRTPPQDGLRCRRGRHKNTRNWVGTRSNEWGQNGPNYNLITNKLYWKNTESKECRSHMVDKHRWPSCLSHVWRNEYVHHEGCCLQSVSPCPLETWLTGNQAGEVCW